MKIIRNKFLPFPGFAAINILGVLFVRKSTQITHSLLRHEMIHTFQIAELLIALAIPFAILASYTSIFVFLLWLASYYICYAFEFLYQYSKIRNFNDAYRANRFELEAYENQEDLHYFLHRKWFAYLRK